MRELHTYSFYLDSQLIDIKAPISHYRYRLLYKTNYYQYSLFFCGRLLTVWRIWNHNVLFIEIWRQGTFWLGSWEIVKLLILDFLGLLKTSTSLKKVLRSKTKQEKQLVNIWNYSLLISEPFVFHFSLILVTMILLGNGRNTITVGEK